MGEGEGDGGGLVAAGQALPWLDLLTGLEPASSEGSGQAPAFRLRFHWGIAPQPSRVCFPASAASTIYVLRLESARENATMAQPLWMRTAADQLGVAEVPGPKSSPRIMQWAAKLRAWLGIDYKDDATPWCGLFVAMCLQSAGYNPPKVAIRAKAWALWGEPLKAGIDGAVLVFERAGGGHVGFYAGETDTAYKVLGGNQGDKVSYAWIAKPRCIAIRWPLGYPKSQPVVLTASGQLSRNEA